MRNGLDERRLNTFLALLETTEPADGNAPKAPADIGGAIQTVDDIVERAKLLAANTTIEAARMGDAGLGMSRLAAEMKKLAAELARAAGVMKNEHGATESDGVDAVGDLPTVRSKVEDLQESQQQMAEILSAHGKAIEALQEDLPADEA